MQQTTAAAAFEAEEALLGWQLRGEIGAIEAVAAEIGDDARFFEAPLDRVQSAIFAAHKMGTSTTPAAIALQIAGDPAWEEINLLEYLRNVAAAAPAVTDAVRFVRAAARSWHHAKWHRRFTKRVEQVLELFHCGDPAAFGELHAASSEASEAQHASAIVASPYTWRDPALIPRRQWVFGRHAIRRFVSVTGAAGGAGKTTLAFADALSVCTGRSLLKDGHVERTNVWYIGLEDPHEEYERRIAAGMIVHRIDAKDLQGLFLDSARNQSFIIARQNDDDSIVAEPVVKGIAAQVCKRAIGLVIVDPFVNCHEVNEQDNTKIAAVVRQWADIAEQTGCAIELLHHTRKANGNVDDDSADELRGAGAFVNAARSVRRLARMTKDESARAGIDDRRRFFRVIAGAKSNLMLHSDEAQWRELVSIDLGNGTVDHPADRVQAAAAWRFPDAADDCSVEQLGAILEKLRAGQGRESVQSPEWAGRAVADVLGLDLGDEAAKASVKAALRKWLREGTLKAVERTDGKTRKARGFLVPAT